VTEHSKLIIDDFVYDPKSKGAGKLAIKVALGTVRYASGKVAHENNKNVNIKTPTATIAVRGTAFTMTVDEVGQSMIILLPNIDGSVGEIEVKTSMGIETLPVVNVDFVHSWEAKPGEEINFSSVRQMIVDLCRKFNVGLVTFDRWQSVEMIQSLKAQGINANFHSVKKTDYDTLMTTIYDTRLRGYWNELLVEEELLKLRLFSNNRIDHPNSGSKDLADAIAGSVFNCIENMSIDQEIEIEILGSGLEYETKEDLEDYGTVTVYNGKEGKNVAGYSKQVMKPEEAERWLETI
jgi:hypothetical protein